MKNDLDALMQTHQLDALLVVGPGSHNPPMTYLTNGADLTQAIILKKRGERPTLFHFSMERDEAAKSGLPTRDLSEFRLDLLVQQAGGDQTLGMVGLFEKILLDQRVGGSRVGLYGILDAGRAYGTFTRLQQALPDLELVGETGVSVFAEAMATKDQAEVERIRRMGKITTEVIGETADFITGHRARNKMMVKANGDPLTIGEVKRRIDLWLAERGAENPEGTIFASGYDAAVPHSTGEKTSPLHLGETIVFDIFPRETGGGYFYDITRTWCLGYAPDEALALHEDVRSVYQQLRSELRLGQACRIYQERACELFEEKGHATVRTNPQTQEGYVHSLGHGVGLHIHEEPFFRLNGPDSVQLTPGAVITVEPGLYYPGRKMGVRLEDTVYARPDGVFETLAEYPLDLVLPVNRSGG
jgi:Xaa-Pro aminopeptidase